MRRQTRRQITNRYTDEHVHALSVGHDNFGSVPEWRGEGFTIDPEKVRGIWHSVRAAVLNAHRQQYGEFTRPAAWWWFDSPQPRDPAIDECDQLIAMNLVAAGDVAEYRAKMAADDSDEFEGAAK